PSCNSSSPARCVRSPSASRRGGVAVAAPQLAPRAPLQARPAGGGFPRAAAEHRVGLPALPLRGKGSCAPAPARRRPAWRRVARLGVAAALTVGLLALSVVDARLLTAAQEDPSPKGKAGLKIGLTVNDPKAFQGYTLLAPMTSTRTYLIDMKGRVVRTWE